MSEEFEDNYVELVGCFLDVGRVREDEARIFLKPVYDEEVGFGKIRTYFEASREVKNREFSYTVEDETGVIEYEVLLDEFPCLVDRLEKEFPELRVYHVDAEELLENPEPLRPEKINSHLQNNDR